MKSKISLPWSLIILVVAGIICSATIIFFTRGFHLSPSLSISNPVPQNTPSVRAKLPVRLVIPTIHVDAIIEDVGLTSQGAMAVPAGPADVAWFDLGPRPGENGSAVIAGHEGWKDGVLAVFDNLYQLRIGDKIYIKDAQDATTTFVVSAVQTYDQNADAAKVFNSNDGKAHLNLVTCEGTWNATEKSYSNRLVVFTDRETK